MLKTITTAAIALLAAWLFLFPSMKTNQTPSYEKTIHVIADKYKRPVDDIRNIVNLAHELSVANGIEPTLTLAIIATESGFNPKAENPSSAAGLMQILQYMHKRTIQGYGGDVFDPETNIKTGLDILSRFWIWTGSEREAVSHYGGDLSGAYYTKVLRNRIWIEETIL